MLNIVNAAARPNTLQYNCDYVTEAWLKVFPVQAADRCNGISQLYPLHISVFMVKRLTI
jgi:hypothetical protein